MSDEIEILNDETPDAPEDKGAEAPEIDYEKLAQHLGPKIRQHLEPVIAQQTQATPSRTPKSHYEEAIDELKRKGVVNESGLANLDRLLDAREKDRRVVENHYRAKEAREQFNAEVNSRFDAKIDEMAKVMPQLKNRAVRQALKDSAHEIWFDKSEFASEIDRVNKGKFPTDDGVNKCVKMAVDNFCNELGLAKPAAPVSLRSSQPDPAPSRGTAGGVGSLDTRQQRFYNTFKSELGHDEALKSAKAI